MFHVIIPARFASTRLPGKPLLPIGDRPLIQWVWQSAVDSGAASVLVATDDERIRAAALKFGADCVMTAPNHVSGTDRIAETVCAKGFAADDIVVNLQGDEPMMPAEVVAAGGAGAARRGRQSISARRSRPSSRWRNFSIPTASRRCARAMDERCISAERRCPGRATASPLSGPPRFAGAWRHIGIYAYRVRSLLQFAAWPPTPLEMTEKLEQLRALEHGMHIHLVTLSESPPAGVDTPEDFERVRAALTKGRAG